MDGATLKKGHRRAATGPATGDRTSEAEGNATEVSPALAREPGFDEYALIAFMGLTALYILLAAILWSPMDLTKVPAMLGF